MLEIVLFGFVCFVLGLIAGPLFLFVLFKLLLRLVKRKTP